MGKRDKRVKKVFKRILKSFYIFLRGYALTLRKRYTKYNQRQLRKKEYHFLVTFCCLFSTARLVIKFWANSYRNVLILYIWTLLHTPPITGLILRTLNEALSTGKSNHKPFSHVQISSVSLVYIGFFSYIFIPAIVKF